MSGHKHQCHAHYICAAAGRLKTDVVGLARAADVSAHTLALLLAGVTKNPTITILRKLALASGGQLGDMLHDVKPVQVETSPDADAAAEA